MKRLTKDEKQKAKEVIERVANYCYSLIDFSIKEATAPIEKVKEDMAKDLECLCLTAESDEIVAEIKTINTLTVKIVKVLAEELKGGKADPNLILDLFINQGPAVDKLILYISEKYIDKTKPASEVKIFELISDIAESAIESIIQEPNKYRPLKLPVVIKPEAPNVELRALEKLVLKSIGKVQPHLPRISTQELELFFNSVNNENPGLLKYFEGDIIDSLASMEDKHAEIFLASIGVAILSVSRAYDFEVDMGKNIGPSKEWCIKALKTVLSSHKVFMALALDKASPCVDIQKILYIVLVSSSINPTSNLEERRALEVLYNNLVGWLDIESGAVLHDSPKMSEVMFLTKKALLLCHFFIEPLSPSNDTLYTLLASESLVASFRKLEAEPQALGKFYKEVLEYSSTSGESINGAPRSDLECSWAILLSCSCFDSLSKYIEQLQSRLTTED